MQTLGSQSKPTKGEKGWRPGVDTVGWLGRARAGKNKMENQSKVILVNAYLNLASLPYQELVQLQTLRPPVGKTKGTTLAAQALSGLTGIPANTIEKTYYLVKAAYWFPSRPMVIFPGNREAPNPQCQCTPQMVMGPSAAWAF